MAKSLLTTALLLTTTQSSAFLQPTANQPTTGAVSTFGFPTTSTSSAVKKSLSVASKPAFSLSDGGLTQSIHHLQASGILTHKCHLQQSTRSHFLAITAASLLTPLPSSALVKGNAPPPKFKSEETIKCRNVEECQEQAERMEAMRAREAAEAAAASGVKPVVVEGTRYLEVEGGSGKSVTMGDKVEVYYKVLKLGKRSYDGLSGEGTVVFSRGYALEDDEKVPGDKSFVFTMGDDSVITALNDAIPGMQVGALRRISILPQKGWNKNTPQCDGGPGGTGAGGDLKTDYVVVPTATMVEQEACFDRAKRPFPQTYAQERRMAQRFDQSLIMEVRLVNVL